MKTRVLVIALLITLIAMGTASAIKPTLKLPYPAGESWLVTRTYNDGTHINADYYAIDFTLSGCNAWDKPIIAIAGGTVETQSFDPDGYGYHVIVNHGDGYKSRYAHLKSVSVSNGQTVTQGQEVGRCGNSGYVLGSSCPEHPGVHLHLALYHNGQAEIMEPMSGYSSFAAGQWYTSNNTGAFYSCAYVSQDPAGAGNEMTQGQTATFEVEFKNTGNTVWRNDPIAYPNDYVELKSCDVGGTVMGSFLYYSNWKNTVTPCTMLESTVYPESQNPSNCVATFRFTGQVSPTAPLGSKDVYFRPNHSANGGTLMQDWGGMHFQVYVVEPTPPPPTPLSVWPASADYNGDGKWDIALLDKRGNGTLYVDYTAGYGYFEYSYPWYGTTPGIWACPADYNGDGVGDYAQLDRDEDHGKLKINYGHDGLANGFGTNQWDWYGNSYQIIPCPADYNGDGIGDYAQLDKSLLGGLIQINFGPDFSTGFTEAYPWYGTGDAVIPCPADYDGDGKDDLAVLDRIGTGVLRINYAADGFASGYNDTFPHYGTGDIIPCPADYNGDGVGDYAQYERETGYLKINYGPTLVTGFDLMMPWYGISPYRFPDPGDYDGDGKDDFAMFDQQTRVFSINYATSLVNGFDEHVDYSIPLAKMASGGELTDIPTTFALSQNYPNPFNPTTTISYSLPEASDVNLDVFNILGQRVAILVNQKQEAGEHTITWDASSVASGVYFYRIQTAEATETKKMLLLK